MDSDDDSQDDLDDGGGGESTSASGRATRLRSWTLLSNIAREAYTLVRRDDQRASVDAHDVYGWLNVNSPGDYNKLHCHDSMQRWSGVFYLAVPSMKTDEDEDEDAGCLGIRGASYTSASTVDGVEVETRTTPYLVYRPRVGELVVFGGDVLHAVASFPIPAGCTTPIDDFEDPDPRSLRVSVAFNVD